MIWFLLACWSLPKGEGNEAKAPTSCVESVRMLGSWSSDFTCPGGTIKLEGNAAQCVCPR